MITLEQYLKGKIEFSKLSPEQQANAMVTIDRVTRFMTACGIKSVTVTDGVRLPGEGPDGSTHRKAAAMDIDDDDQGTLWKKAFENRKKLKEIGLWMEHPCWTHYYDQKAKRFRSWLHFQITPPGSGNRIYVPSTAPNPNPSFWDGKYEADLNSKDQPKAI